MSWSLQTKVVIAAPPHVVREKVSERNSCRKLSWERNWQVAAPWLRIHSRVLSQRLCQSNHSTIAKSVPQSRRSGGCRHCTGQVHINNYCKYILCTVKFPIFLWVPQLHSHTILLTNDRPTLRKNLHGKVVYHISLPSSTLSDLKRVKKGKVGRNLVKKRHSQACLGFMLVFFRRPTLKRNILLSTRIWRSGWRRIDLSRSDDKYGKLNRYWKVLGYVLIARSEVHVEVKRRISATGWRRESKRSWHLMSARIHVDVSIRSPGLLHVEILQRDKPAEVILALTGRCGSWCRCEWMCRATTEKVFTTLQHETAPGIIFHKCIQLRYNLSLCILLSLSIHVICNRSLKHCPFAGRSQSACRSRFLESRDATHYVMHHEEDDPELRESLIEWSLTLVVRNWAHTINREHLVISPDSVRLPQTRDRQLARHFPSRGTNWDPEIFSQQSRSSRVSSDLTPCDTSSTNITTMTSS